MRSVRINMGGDTRHNLILQKPLRSELPSRKRQPARSYSTLDKILYGSPARSAPAARHRRRSRLSWDFVHPSTSTRAAPAVSLRPAVRASSTRSNRKTKRLSVALCGSEPQHNRSQRQRHCPSLVSKASHHTFSDGDKSHHAACTAFIGIPAAQTCEMRGDIDASGASIAPN